ncbi:MAG: HD domain-containing protein [Burkholderiaceae bacterium]|jgi:hypothetical protein|nr:HD domain-containing protein [Burkholderiaceae bacterium]
MADLIDRARQFASAAHRNVGQLRKYSGQPYEEHLRQVAEIVSRVTDDAEMIAAAWLHDVVEDTPITIEEVERAFGPGVRELVDALTDVSRPHHGNRAARKALDREHLAGAPARAQTVKLADLIDNCQDICSRNPRFGRVFLVEMSALLNVLTAGDEKLRRKAKSELDKWSKRLAAASPPASPAAPVLPGGPLGNRIRRALRLLSQGFRAGDLAAAEPDPVAGEALPPVKPTQLLAYDATLADVVTVLTRHDVCYVTVQGKVTGHIGRDEMQGPVVRMWLFGMITSVELIVTEGIRSAGSALDWAALLAPARLEKALALQRARAGLGRPVPLLDCLQLSDKIRIVLAADDHPRPLFRGSSKAESQRFARDLEDLRNSLAHAQDIVTHDWSQIARLARRLDEVTRDGDIRGE